MPRKRTTSKKIKKKLTNSRTKILNNVKSLKKILSFSTLVKKTKLSKKLKNVQKPKTIKKHSSTKKLKAIQKLSSTQTIQKIKKIKPNSKKNQQVVDLRLSSEFSLETLGASVCREVACELVATTGEYCRLHYLKNWKKIKRRELILKEGKLNNYIEELVSKYPDKYIAAIRQDLANEKDFSKVIADLEIEERLDDFETVDSESPEGIIDNIKRDYEDEGETF